jgi:hypothetical protein
MDSNGSDLGKSRKKEQKEIGGFQYSEKKDKMGPVK